MCGIPTLVLIPLPEGLPGQGRHKLLESAVSILHERDSLPSWLVTFYVRHVGSRGISRLVHVEEGTLLEMKFTFWIQCYHPSDRSEANRNRF